MKVTCISVNLNNNKAYLIFPTEEIGIDATSFEHTVRENVTLKPLCMKRPAIFMTSDSNGLPMAIVYEASNCSLGTQVLDFNYQQK